MCEHFSWILKGLSQCLKLWKGKPQLWVTWYHFLLSYITQCFVKGKCFQQFHLKQKIKMELYVFLDPQAWQGFTDSGCYNFFFENLFEIHDCYSLKDVVISVVVKKNIALDELSRLTEQDVSSVPPHMTLKWCLYCTCITSATFVVFSSLRKYIYCIHKVKITL